MLIWVGQIVLNNCDHDCWGLLILLFDLNPPALTYTHAQHLWLDFTDMLLLLLGFVVALSALRPLPFDNIQLPNFAHNQLERWVILLLLLLGFVVVLMSLRLLAFNHVRVPISIATNLKKGELYLTLYHCAWCMSFKSWERRREMMLGHR